jgi:hypothetical protein
MEMTINNASDRTATIKTSGHHVLDVEMEPNDSGATTIRGYLCALAAAVWNDGEGFTGKHPFGNSGWESDLYSALVKADLVEGTLDEHGSLMDADCDTGRALINEAIKALAEPERIDLQLFRADEPASGPIESIVELANGSRYRITAHCLLAANVSPARLRTLHTQYTADDGQLQAQPLDDAGQPCGGPAVPVNFRQLDAEMASEALNALTWLMRVNRGLQRPPEEPHLLRDNVLYWINGDALVACPIGWAGEVDLTFACRTPLDAVSESLTPMIQRLQASMTDPPSW